MHQCKNMGSVLAALSGHSIIVQKSPGKSDKEAGTQECKFSRNWGQNSDTSFLKTCTSQVKFCSSSQCLCFLLFSSFLHTVYGVLYGI